MLEELDDRQKLLGGVTLLLILAHLFFPKAGVDETSAVLLAFLSSVLYGKELTRALRVGWRMAMDAPERRAARAAALAQATEPAAEPEPAPVEAALAEEAPVAPTPRTSDLADRIRQLSYQVEHARVAMATEGLAPGARSGDVAWDVVQRSGGQARVALLLTWSALEQRLHAATGMTDAAAAAHRLVEDGRAPRQLAEALDAFRRVRNEVAQSVNGGVADDALWALVDIGTALGALIPGEPAPS